MSRRTQGFIAAFSLILFCGCSRSPHPTTAPVSGTVMYKGQPVDDAVVVFVPQGTGRTATATTDRQGKFRLSSFGEFDGAVPGGYKVTVTKTEKTTSPPKSQDQLHEEFEQQLKTGMEPPPPVVKYLVPEKYLSFEKTPLEFTIKPGQNDIPIELTD